MAMVTIDQLSGSPQRVALNAAELLNILSNWHQEVEEIMVQVFDYLYFYGQDAEMYVKVQLVQADEKLTQSSRVDDYVLRILCALMSSHLRRGAIAKEVCITQLQQIFKILSEAGTAALVFHEAIKNLSNDDSNVRSRLAAYSPIIRIVRTFLFSDLIAAQLRQESWIIRARDSRGGYGLVPQLFEFGKISNPMRFLWHYSDDVRPSSVRSAWILNTLAFNTSYEIGA